MKEVEIESEPKRVLHVKDASRHTAPDLAVISTGRCTATMGVIYLYLTNDIATDLHLHSHLTFAFTFTMCIRFPESEPQPDVDVTVDHKAMMQEALEEAKKSTPKPSNYCVGALLVDSETGDVLSRGYTLEIEGNTHAEQCCLIKFAQAHDLSEESVGEILPPNVDLYTTMEPCNMRLSGSLPCVDRILRTKNKDGTLAIKRVFLGVKEPEKFVGENQGRTKLEEHGIECIHISGLEAEILKIATAGHEK